MSFDRSEPDDRGPVLDGTPVETQTLPEPGSGPGVGPNWEPGSGTPVVVRRHAGVAALIGGAAAAVAIAYLWRASESGAVLDWALCAVMGLIAGYYLSALVDARTPLLVADDLGVRLRLGHQWRGLPWEAVGQVVVHPRRGVLRDGRIVLVPHSLARAVDGLDHRARRHLALNQKMYGAPLAVPMGATTRLSGTGAGDVTDALLGLSHGRSDVVELDARTLEVVERQPAADSEPAGADAHAVRRDTVLTEEPDEAPAGEPPGAGLRSILGGIGTVVSRVAKGRSHDVDVPAASAGAPLAAEVVPAGTPGPKTDPGLDPGAGPGTDPRLDVRAPAALRQTRPASRAEATIVLPTAGATALDPADRSRATGLPEGRELRRPGSVDLVFEPVPLDDRVRPISTMGDAVEPLVIDDYVTEPAYDPVIGPELTAARTRLGLSVDDVAERTRIRPHVIESIEVDDFAPCGGDFYARGHLRTLARILGKDPAPMIETFDRRYAAAPINARRVFEAELATGMTGSMRATFGGPSWGLLVGVVLSLVLVWGVVRLFEADPVETVPVPGPILGGTSMGVEQADPVDPAPAAGGGVGTAVAPGRPVTVLVTAAQTDARVVIRDGQGTVAFRGVMVLGERKTLDLTPPVRVRASDGGVEVRLNGRELGALGVTGEPARRTFR